MGHPEVVLLDGQHRHFRAAVLKTRGYRVFTTEHVVEVCLRWSAAGCAALIIGPQIHWQDVATLCEWIKINSPEKPILLLSDQRRKERISARVNAVVPTQPVQALLKMLSSHLPATMKPDSKMTAIQDTGRQRPSLHICKS